MAGYEDIITEGQERSRRFSCIRSRCRQVHTRDSDRVHRFVAHSGCTSLVARKADARTGGHDRREDFRICQSSDGFTIVILRHLIAEQSVLNIRVGRINRNRVGRDVHDRRRLEGVVINCDGRIGDVITLINLRFEPERTVNHRFHIGPAILFVQNDIVRPDLCFAIQIGHGFTIRRHTDELRAEVDTADACKVGRDVATHRTINKVRRDRHIRRPHVVRNLNDHTTTVMHPIRCRRDKRRRNCKGLVTRILTINAAVPGNRDIRCIDRGTVSPSSSGRASRSCQTHNIVIERCLGCRKGCIERDRNITTSVVGVAVRSLCNLAGNSVRRVGRSHRRRCRAPFDTDQGAHFTVVNVLIVADGGRGADIGCCKNDTRSGAVADDRRAKNVRIRNDGRVVDVVTDPGIDHCRSSRIGHIVKQGCSLQHVVIVIAGIVLLADRNKCRTGFTARICTGHIGRRRVNRSRINRCGKGGCLVADGLCLNLVGRGRKLRVLQIPVKIHVDNFITAALDTGKEVELIRILEGCGSNNVGVRARRNSRRVQFHHRTGGASVETVTVGRCNNRVAINRQRRAVDAIQIGTDGPVTNNRTNVRVEDGLRIARNNRGSRIVSQLSAGIDRNVEINGIDTDRGRVRLCNSNGTKRVVINRSFRTAKIDTVDHADACVSHSARQGRPGHALIADNCGTARNGRPVKSNGPRGVVAKGRGFDRVARNRHVGIFVGPVPLKIAADIGHGHFAYRVCAIHVLKVRHNRVTIDFVTIGNLAKAGNCRRADVRRRNIDALIGGVQRACRSNGIVINSNGGAVHIQSIDANLCHDDRGISLSGRATNDRIVAIHHDLGVGQSNRRIHRGRAFTGRNMLSRIVNGRRRGHVIAKNRHGRTIDNIKGRGYPSAVCACKDIAVRIRSLQRIHCDIGHNRRIEFRAVDIRQGRHIDRGRTTRTNNRKVVRKVGCRVIGVARRHNVHGVPVNGMSRVEQFGIYTINTQCLCGNGRTEGGRGHIDIVLNVLDICRGNIVTESRQRVDRHSRRTAVGSRRSRHGVVVKVERTSIGKGFTVEQVQVEFEVASITCGCRHIGILELVIYATKKCGCTPAGSIERIVQTSKIRINTRRRCTRLGLRRKPNDQRSRARA